MFFNKRKKLLESLNRRLSAIENGQLSLQRQHLKFVNKSPNANPSYAKTGDSGFDLRAWVDCNTAESLYDKNKDKYYVEIGPHEVKLIHTGLYLDIPENCEVQVRPRSGYALKVGISVNNSPGTIDHTYTGEIGVICINPTNRSIRISNDDKIAQAVLCPVYNEPLVELVETNVITKVTDRGENGFGHSGM